MQDLAAADCPVRLRTDRARAGLPAEAGRVAADHPVTVLAGDPEGEVIGRHLVEGHLAWASPAPLGVAVPDETA